MSKPGHNRGAARRKANEARPRNEPNGYNHKGDVTHAKMRPRRRSANMTSVLIYARRNAERAHIGWRRKNAPGRVIER